MPRLNQQAARRACRIVALLVVAMVATDVVFAAPQALPPVRAAPVQVAPVRAAPVQVAPVRAAPVQVAPVQVAPAKVIRAMRIGPDLGAAEDKRVEQPSEPESAEIGVAAEATNLGSDSVMSLINGNTMVGKILPSPTAGVFRWQGRDFSEPLQVLRDAVKSIRFPASKRRDPQSGEFAFELTSGDLFSGRLVNWTAEKITIESSLFGLVSVRSRSIRRLYRIEENPTIVFASLAGLQDWDSAVEASDSDVETKGWSEDGSHLWTDQSDASLNANLGVPDKAMVEFEISWTGTPNFVFVIAAGTEGDRRTDGWRIETFAETLAVVRETRSSADVAPLESLSDKKRIRLIAYLDQSSRQIQIFRPDGTRLAGISPLQLPADGEGGGVGVGVDEPLPAQGGIRLINRHGQVRLERLRVARWSGKIPTMASSGDITVSLADGTTVLGSTIHLDSDKNRLVIGGSNESVPLEDVVAVKVSRASAEDGQAKASLFLHDGSRISGAIDSIKAEGWVVRSGEFSDPVLVRHELVRTMIVLDRDPIVPLAGKAGRKGRLQLGQHQLAGHLVSAVEEAAGDGAGVSCLRWQPFGCLNSSPLDINSNGRIVYRDPPPAAKPAASASNVRALLQQQARLQQQRRGLNFGSLFLRNVDSEPTVRRVGSDAHKLHIRSGDVIPCVIDAIDADGAWITTASAGDVFVPHGKVKAIELVANVSPPSLKEAKRKRLLTLPRLQKSSPPTHLLCSRDGDFLRCRLLAINSESIRVELQLEEIDIPRDRVAQIIWFHPEELIAKGAAAEQDPENEPTSQYAQLAQVLKRDGKRVTFDPQQVDGATISGVSDVLGACRFKLGEIDQLLFGEGIRDAVVDLPYNQWQLQAAVEPLMAQDNPGGPEVGSESPLIGLEAPEIRLELLDGKPFVLSQCKDQIVVLDFWATWCAPCMQTMPLVEEAIAQFDPDQVRLVSVNLEESADQIRSALERHGLGVAVALDIDGVAAQRYQARAIPQMVIVGRGGKVERLYVGGGSKMVQLMTKSISELLESPP